MYILVNDIGQIWNWHKERWQDVPDSNGQSYSHMYTARNATKRVESLQGSLFEGLKIMTYDEWATMTGGTW